MLQKELSKKQLVRLNKIKQYLLEGRSYTEIAGLCGITRMTLYRDIRAWIKTGDFDEWLREEWLKIHQDVMKKKDMKEVYRQLSGMIKRRIAEKIEAEVKETVTVTPQVDWDSLSDAERTAIIQGAHILISKDRSEKRSSDIH